MHLLFETGWVWGRKDGLVQYWFYYGGFFWNEYSA